VKNRLREITYLVAARTTRSECIPVFSTRFAEQAVNRVNKISPGLVNDAAQRLGMPAGSLIEAWVIELMNGTPSRALPPRPYVAKATPADSDNIALPDYEDDEGNNAGEVPA
jgi:hypothetical protein